MSGEDKYSANTVHKNRNEKDDGKNNNDKTYAINWWQND